MHVHRGLRCVWISAWEVRQPTPRCTLAVPGAAPQSEKQALAQQGSSKAAAADKHD